MSLEGSNCDNVEETDSALKTIDVEDLFEIVLIRDFSPLLCSQMEIRVMTVAVVAIVTMSTLLAFMVSESEARPSRTTAVVSEGWPEYMNTFYRGGDQHRRAVNECDNSVSSLKKCLNMRKSPLLRFLCRKYTLL